MGSRVAARAYEGRVWWEPAYRGGGSHATMRPLESWGLEARSQKQGVPGKQRDTLGIQLPVTLIIEVIVTRENDFSRAEVEMLSSFGSY